MKRNILFCLILFSLQSNAQVFGGPGSTWWIQHAWVAGGGVEKYVFINDTLIANRSYKNITGRGFAEGLGIPGTNFYNINIAPIYVSNDTVAIGPPNNLIVQFAFNANVGDSWVVNNNGEYVIVEAKFDTIISNQTLRAMLLRKYADTIAHYNTTLVIEKMGTISDNFLPSSWRVIDSTMIGIDDGTFYRLNCFQNNELGFIHSPSDTTYADCDNLLPVNEQQANLLTTYPNPTNNILKIDGLKNQPFTYTLYNAAGQIIRAEKATGNTIDLSENMPGLYFVRISLANGYTQAIKVVKE